MNEVSTIIKTFPHSGRLEELARNLETERDALRARNAELTETLMKAADTFRDFAMADRALGKPLRAAASEVAENATREVLAKVSP